MSDDMTIQMIKAAIAAVGGVLISLLGGGDSALKLFGAMIVFDFALGILKSLKAKTFASAVMRWGAVNKALEAAVIMVLNLFDNAMGMEIFRNGAITWFCICEAASIVENLVHLGVPCPDDLQKTLTRIKMGISISLVDVLEKVIEEKTQIKKEDGEKNEHDDKP